MRGRGRLGLHHIVSSVGTGHNLIEHFGDLFLKLVKSRRSCPSGFRRFLNAVFVLTLALVVLSGRDLDSATAAVKRIIVIVYRETGIVRFGNRCDRRDLEAFQRLGSSSTARRCDYRGHQREVCAAY